MTSSCQTAEKLLVSLFLLSCHSSLIALLVAGQVERTHCILVTVAVCTLTYVQMMKGAGSANPIENSHSPLKHLVESL